MKKIVIALVLLMGGMLLLPLGATETLENESGPEFEVYLGTTLGNSFQYGTIQVYVKNIGDEPAHNVTLTDFIMDGPVVYNNRGVDWHDFDDDYMVEPGESIVGAFESCVIGFGTFSTMMVTCDEGTTGTGSGNGIILGFLIFIP